MASTTPRSPPSRARSTSRTRRAPPSRPTTPLRAPSRTSLRASTTTPLTTSGGAHGSGSSFPLEALEPAFAEFSDGMADLEANMMHLQLLHESIARFNENFAGFLYGLNMSAFTVDFPEAPGSESFRRAAQAQREGRSTYTGAGMDADAGFGGRMDGAGDVRGARGDVDATFLTTDTSFVDNPPASTKPASKFTNPSASGPSLRAPSSTRGGAGASSRGRGIPTRGARGGSVSSTRGSGIGRGRATSRGTR